MSQYGEIAGKIKEADAILIGASNGFSITEGLHLFAGNAAFEELFGDYKQKYGIHNILEGFFFRWATQEERWGYLSRLVEHYSGSYQKSPVMDDLKAIVGEKPYFIVTSNGEGHFELAGFQPERIYEVEGNWLELKCSCNCHEKTYPSMEMIHQMAKAQSQGKIPTAMLPKCPKCGSIMTFYDAQPVKGETRENWNRFLQEYHEKKLVILELGIGWRNQLIKAPLMKLTEKEPHATYITINLGEVYITDNIKEKSYGLDGYLNEVLAEIKNHM